MERLSMRQIREILRQHWVLRHSNRQIALGVRKSRAVVSKMVTRAQAAGLDWTAVEALSDEELEKWMYGETKPLTKGRAEPDPVYMNRELKRPGVTLELLHLEYLREHPDGYKYTSFCNRYRKWRKDRGLWMRQDHKAGEKTFVDYSGKKPHIIDPKTGHRVELELFVGTLGASSFTYSEATPTQQLADWVSSHERMFEYFGGVTKAVVPDQLRSAVKQPDWTDPMVNQTYEDLARHYNTSVIPARPGKPRDKAKVERAVQIAQRWILACIRNETFFSLEDINARIRELNDALNDRPMKRFGNQTRRQFFEHLDKPELLPLPSTRFVYADWSKAKVNLDYHIEVDRHYYSVPYVLARESVEVRLTATTVEVLYKHRVVAAHQRSHEPYRHTTVPEHMPPNHRAWLELDESGVREWAATVGPMTEALIQTIIESRPIAAQGLRSAMGLRRVGREYGPKRTEMACAQALSFGAKSYKPVANILKHGRENPTEEVTEKRVIEHENVRGPDYYNN